MELPISPDISQFDGPKTAIVFGKPYVTLTSGGIVPDGCAARLFASALEAWGYYFAALAEHIGQAHQIAWRIRPELREDKGAFYVYSRLYAFRYEG